MSRDLYLILAVERSASQAEIKRAFRRLAKRFHPDLHRGSKFAEEKFKWISESETNTISRYGRRSAVSGGPSVVPPRTSEPAPARRPGGRDRACGAYPRRAKM